MSPEPMPEPSGGTSSLLHFDLHGCFASDRAHAAGPLMRELPPAAFVAAGGVDFGIDDTVEFTSDELPKTGTILDKYQIEEHLGSGGFAAVYRATHLLMQAPVALKLLMPRLALTRPHLAERMCEEARFTALVSHPNVVRVYDVTHTARMTYIVMEYIKGASLAKLVAQGALPVRDALRLGIDVCQGLGAAMCKGLIHCDVKPGNILIAEDAHAKLVDFGLARLGSVSERADQPRDIVGTPAYMAPEQAQDPEGIDHRADIYSLGATLFHALAGHPIFPARQPLEAIYHHVHTTPAGIDTLNREVPPGLADLIGRMLSKDRSERPASYDDIVAEMRGIFSELAPPDAEPGGERASASELFSRVRRLFTSRRRVMTP